MAQQDPPQPGDLGLAAPHAVADASSSCTKQPASFASLPPDLKLAIAWHVNSLPRPDASSPDSVGQAVQAALLEADLGDEDSLVRLARRVLAVAAPCMSPLVALSLVDRDLAAICRPLIWQYLWCQRCLIASPAAFDSLLSHVLPTCGPCVVELTWIAWTDENVDRPSKMLPYLPELVTLDLQDVLAQAADLALLLNLLSPTLEELSILNPPSLSPADPSPPRINLPHLHSLTILLSVRPDASFASLFSFFHPSPISLACQLPHHDPLSMVAILEDLKPYLRKVTTLALKPRWGGSWPAATLPPVRVWCEAAGVPYEGGKAGKSQWLEGPFARVW
ncbi:hypothetical protein JCM10213_002235 [Rhodosporidiobolus nylandii]